ncbi:hypothetical protein ACHAXS_001918 [Conticribra weissflogii]
MQENEHETNSTDSSSENSSNRIVPRHQRGIPARRAFRRLSNGVSNRLRRRILPELRGRANGSADEDDGYLTSNLNFDRELLFEGEADAAAGGSHRHPSDANVNPFPRPQLVQRRRSSFDAREILADAEFAIPGRNRRSSEVSADNATEEELERFLREGRGIVTGDDNLGGSFLRMYFGMRDSFLLHGARVAAAPLPQESDSRSSGINSLESADSSGQRRIFRAGTKTAEFPSSASSPSDDVSDNTVDVSRNSSIDVSEDDAKPPPAAFTDVNGAIDAAAKAGSWSSEDNEDEIDILNDSFSSFAISGEVQDTAILEKISKWKSIHASATTATTINSSITNCSTNNASTSLGFLLGDSFNVQNSTSNFTRLKTSNIIHNLEVVQDDNLNECESEGHIQENQNQELGEDFSKIGRRSSTRTGKRRGYSERESESRV